MKKFDFKLFVPHIVAIITFLLLSVVFTKPALEGMVVQQHDVQQVKAMQQQSIEFEKKYGYYPSWTNSMFGGMPGYQIAYGPKNGSIPSVAVAHDILSLGLPKPVYYLFITCLCFYFLCIVIGVNPWLSILGGIAYGYCSYNPILIAVGHDTKLLSMAYAPGVIGAMLLLFKKKYWLGGSLLLIFTTCLLIQSHQQIVFYTLIIAGIVFLYFLINAIKEKQYQHILRTTALSILMPVIAFFICSIGYLSTYEYAKESMRGGSELTDKTKVNKSKTGLDRDYAFSWSYGIGETLTFLVPNAYGGGSSTPMPEESKVLEVLQENQQQLPQQMSQQLYQAASAYWGAKPSTSGPVYFGAIICLLAIFTLFFGKSKHKWWLLAVTVVGIILAWGKNFGIVNNFLFDHLPFYNKFRTPEMAMVIPQLSVAMLSVLFVNELVTITDKEKLNKLAKNCLIATGGVIALLLGFYFFADFKNEATYELKKNLTAAMQNNNPEFITSYISAIVKDRQALYSADMWRSIGFILVGIAAIFLFCKKIINAPVLFSILILFTAIDLLSVDKRYLNADNFIEPADYESAYADYNADIQIKRDPGYFRVLNLAFRDPNSGNFQASIGNAFNDAIASYKHNNIGGYHPAKLGVFEDLKEKQIYKNIESWSTNSAAKDSFKVLNMLNMKYIIVPDQANPKQTMAIPNPYAMGPCWLVKDIKFVKTANEEMESLDSFDPASTAIINEKYKSTVPVAPVYDSTASIKLITNKNDSIKYEFNASTNQFAVFSEMYYGKGWHAYIDGKETPYVKVNYALRGLAIPAGKHTIDFVFNSKLVTMSENLAKAGSIFSWLFVALSAFMIWKKRDNKNLTVDEK
ncbi:MAG: YfhO family protein [Bacteroidota bacterium]